MSRTTFEAFNYEGAIRNICLLAPPPHGSSGMQGTQSQRARNMALDPLMIASMFKSVMPSDEMEGDPTKLIKQTLDRHNQRCGCQSFPNSIKADWCPSPFPSLSWRPSCNYNTSQVTFADGQQTGNFCRCCFFCRGSPCCSLATSSLTARLPSW